MLVDLYTPQGEQLKNDPSLQPWQRYPRPQLRRDSFLNLNGEWEFAVGETEPEVYDRRIRVPFCPESKLSGIGEHFEEAPYENIDVVDRIGSGDAYVAGALYALLRFRSIEKMAEYGDAMAALKNTVLGDTTQCDITDIERIIDNHKTTGPKNEMVR